MKGAPKTDYFFAIAISKSEAGWPAVLAEIQKAAAEAWPAGESKLPGFKWKIEDGDDPKNAKKEGFPGCWIVKCKSGLMPMGYRQNAQKTGYDPLLEPLKEIKCGDYAWVSVNIAGNNQPGAQAGIFMNGYKYVFMQMGEEITSGPSAEDVFGTTMPVMAGAAVAGTPAIVPPHATDTPAGVPAPDMSFVHPPVTPTPVTTVTPPVAGGIVVTEKAGPGMTWKRLEEVGWTEPVARKLGMIV